MSKINGTFAFIGGGNMGGAIIRGIVLKGLIAPDQIVVCCKHSDKYPAFRQLGVRTANSIAEAVDGASFIFLCVKPKSFSEVLEECKNSAGCREDAVYISIAASVPSEFVCSCLGKQVPVIRTMPSMPLAIGEGTVALCHNSFVDHRDFEMICRLFASIATISIMDESCLNPVISVNGSSPAYVYLFIKALLDGAKEQGLSEEQAMPLILRTLVGSAKMVEKSDVSIDEMIRQVCSPGGTTLAAMKVFEDADFVGIVKNAMIACTDRANEISETFKV